MEALPFSPSEKMTDGEPFDELDLGRDGRLSREDIQGTIKSQGAWSGFGRLFY